MNLCFDKSIADQYTSNSQRIRVMSERWVERNVYCPCCGSPHIVKLDNNTPVADFQCESCEQIFELKSKKEKICRKIADGAYSTMIERITSVTNPDLFVLRYAKTLDVTDLIIIPKFFFVPQIIEKRHALSDTARRSGWVGCNILLSEIPQQGCIPIIRNRQVFNPKKVVEQYRNISKLQITSIKRRRWLIDILNCVNRINKVQFTLSEIYDFRDELKRRHPDNYNVEAKIRQQLQVLRDKGILEAVARGVYRKR